MSDNNNQTSVRQNNDATDIPVAAIVSLSVGGYVILVMIFLVIRRLLVSKGMLESSCCCPEGLHACCVCEKVEEVYRSCCGSCCREGCLAICGINKEKKCKDIFCCCFTCQQGCFTCQQGCCDPCTSLCSTCLYSCCHPSKCCTCDSYCPSCFGKVLDPNACGCLCLEIKLRTARRSSSAPPRGSQNQNINVDVLPDDISNLDNMYHTGQLNGSIAGRTLVGEGKIGDGNTRERRRSSSHSPIKKATHSHQMLPGNLHAFTKSNIPESQNSVRVNFNSGLDESLARQETQYLSSSAVLSNSAPGDLFTRSSIKRAGISEIEPNYRSASRSRRLIRPGQISQRFPNKILVTSESLNFSSLEITETFVSDISLIPNNEESLSNVAVQYDDVNVRRPLPPSNRTV